LTPAARALSSTALPLAASRLTIIRTLAPLLIISSAMRAKFSALPWALRMSAGTPAARKAALSSFGSSLPQRCEVVVSGRITPTLVPLTPAAALSSSLQPARPPTVSTPAVTTATSFFSTLVLLPRQSAARLTAGAGMMDRVVM
jgi:hypothetical protein